MNDAVDACIKRVERGGTLGEIAEALNDAVLLLRKQAIDAETAYHTLEPVGDIDWAGKWRVKKALELLGAHYKPDRKTPA